ncbi:MarR family winged helix-turn-helix transcriptional regulator [Phycisphaera mikurensis]|uniref:MarR family transcriptional regulator n=1 Tax=Phycisphaera mikurensis (strain NBRC 102666 / KCTC 22515 / FYK2301M01) TaxID=1142394 RepID=I0II53_PHYMF|nr:MarR family transcriptional regulator [Phycisphaera mikurensis]MBB6442496.1 DNA-binding MarR family transcriptional regulator [Phycisphaera mikurensis]BAM04941.1 MarR family transcriptional regulator [Phycisphaera mikurensis NBRC 102666]
MPSRLQRKVGKAGPFDFVQQELYLNLVRTASIAAEPVQRCLKAHGLREPAFNVLRIVAGRGAEGLPSQAIGAHTVSRVPDITRLVDGLEKRGLVERRRCPHDRRVVHVVITAAGRRKAERASRDVDAVHRSQFPGLTEPRIARLIRLLERARERDAGEG